jgi:putative transposase
MADGGCDSAGALCAQTGQSGVVNGTRFRALTVVDVFTREALCIRVDQRLRGHDVGQVCNELATQRGSPLRLFVDNGSEFSGRLLDLWAYHHKAPIDFSRPGSPTDNCFVEIFNGSLRDECLNVHWLELIDETRTKIEAWRVDYNESRPHQALDNLTSKEYAEQTSVLQLST